jgi:hypothetical protein
LPEIWLGDLARAWAAVNARTPEHRAAVARLLGLNEPSPRGHEDVTKSELTETPPPAPREEHPVPVSPSVPDVEDGEAVDTLDDSDAPEGLIRQIGVEPVAVIRSGATLPRPSVVPAARPHLPLIDPRLDRSVIQALLSQPGNEGPIDVDALVQHAATSQVNGLPRRGSRTLRFGVQVLNDEGEGMSPFARDQEYLTRKVRDLVGHDTTHVLYFADAPLRGAGPGPIWTWESYRPPPPGRRILLLSHLGIGGPWPDRGRARRAEWEAFADLCRRRDNRVVALVPYPLTRIPRWAGRLFALVSWDRTLTTGRAVRARP